MPRDRRPPIAWAPLGALAFAKIAIHALSAATPGYGYFADELYYLDCAARLDWGYVDHPPFSIAVLRLARDVFGTSLFALRSVPALAGAACVVLAGLMARELGGGRTAQTVAAIAVLISPLFLFVGSFFSMNGFEPLLWGLTSYLLFRLFNGAPKALWLAVGALLGLALLNKLSTLWFGAGIATGLILSEQRRWLATPWPWLAAAIATVLFAPFVLWEIDNSWPLLEFMQRGRELVMVHKGPVDFLGEQIGGIHPILLPFWLSGLIALLVAPAMRRFSLFAWVWIVCAAILAGSGTARPYYMVPVYLPLFAAAGALVENVAERLDSRAIPIVVIVLFIVAGVVTAPMSLPLLAPPAYVDYERRIGSLRAETEFEEGLLPAQLSFRIGWREVAEAVARTHRSLPQNDRDNVAVLAFSFPTAAAASFFSEELDLPRVLGTHNHYWLWGRDATPPDVVLAVANDDEKLLEHFEDVRHSTRVDCTYCPPELSQTSVWICRVPNKPWEEIWQTLRDFS